MKEIKSFAELTLPPILQETLAAMEFTTPTPVQAQAIPPGLEGRDVLAIAPTGTGKTGAFGIPALTALYHQPGKQVLVLAPTRELAAQISRFMRKLAEPMDLHGTLIVGGESYTRQRSQVKRGVDYIVATPGRLMDHIEQGMPLENINMLVLDEVDRMLDMGFAPQVEEIVKRMPPERQTFLFSATLPKEIVRLANAYLKNPVNITVAKAHHEKPLIDEERIQTTDPEKPALLLKQLSEREGKILIFANTQGRVEQVSRRLAHAEIPAAAIHGGRTHRERKGALEAFRNGEVRVLVATDIVARGIDVPDVEHVINYDLPASHEDYTHRIGRTGRIGKKGSAISFVDEKRRMKQRGGRSVGGGGGRPVRGAAGRSPHGRGPVRSSGDRGGHGRTPTRSHAGERAMSARPPSAERPMRNADSRAESRPHSRTTTRRPDFEAGHREESRKPEFRPRTSHPRAGMEDRPRRTGFGARPHHGAGDRLPPAFGDRPQRPHRGDAARPHRSSGERSFESDRPRKPFRPHGDRPAKSSESAGAFGKRPNKNVFREGEEKLHRAKPGPRKFVHAADKKTKAASSASPSHSHTGFKPWVRGKKGTVRRGGRGADA